MLDKEIKFRSITNDSIRYVLYEDACKFFSAARSINDALGMRYGIIERVGVSHDGFARVIRKHQASDFLASLGSWLCEAGTADDLETYTIALSDFTAMRPPTSALAVFSRAKPGMYATTYGGAKISKSENKRFDKRWHKVADDYNGERALDLARLYLTATNEYEIDRTAIEVLVCSWYCYEHLERAGVDLLGKMTEIYQPLGFITRPYDNDDPNYAIDCSLDICMNAILGREMLRRAASRAKDFVRNAERKAQIVERSEAEASEEKTG